jgi:hypothetical protein
MSLITTLENDLRKILAFLPFVSSAAAIVDPADAAALAVVAKEAEAAKAIITALQPTISALQDAHGGVADHATLVAGVNDAIVRSSSQLSSMGVLSGTIDQHIEATGNLVNAAVAISGLAAK